MCLLEEFFYGNISLKKAEEMQDEMELGIKKLEKYSPRISERNDLQKIVLDNRQKLFEGRDMIIEAFRKYIFRFFEKTENSESDSEFDSEFDSESELERKSGESIGERLRLRKQEHNELNELIAENDRIIDKDLFKRYFGYDSLSDMQADLYKAKNISSNETKTVLKRVLSII